jgi:hypothetical protein
VQRRGADTRTAGGHVSSDDRGGNRQRRELHVQPAAGGPDEGRRHHIRLRRRNRLTLQHISLVNGKKVPTRAIPSANPPCSQGWNDGEGVALYMRDGNLTVIDAIFTNNQAAPLGPDTGGGAIYVLGTSDNMMGTLAITDTTMKGNTGGSRTNVSSGSVTKVGTAIGVNAKSITVTNSTLRGYP